MRHNDPRLTANTYADASLFALRSGVEKLSGFGSEDDAQRDAQETGARGLSPSLPVTVDGVDTDAKWRMNPGVKSLSGTECHSLAKKGDWLQRQGSCALTPKLPLFSAQFDAL